MAESPSISVDPPTDHRHFDLWRNRLPTAISEDKEHDDIHIRTLLTSPRRSIMRYSAFLLSPIRPSKNTISGTRSRSVQFLYAYMEVGFG